ncbi:MAG: hypothetical protein K6C10_03615 [Prevotella sp.]|nr:hypothetical protein [Prevotella sp.]
MQTKGLVKYTVALVCLLASTTLSAQNPAESEVQVSLVNKYMWRGMEKGGISLQPMAKVKWEGLYAQLFGSKGFESGDAEELDLSIGYEFPFGLNIGVNDYWQSGIEPRDLYFAYQKETTGHRLEGNIGYTCRYGSLQAYCIFYGHDTKLDGSQAYSTYIELTVPFRLGGLDWTAKAGITPMESAGVAIPDYSTLTETHEYFYAEGPACVMASLRATKDIHLRGGITIPVFAELHTNPYLQTAHVMGGIGIKLNK